MKFMLKLSSITALLMALLAGGALFWVSQQVQQAEREQRQLQQVAIQEQEAIRVLNAEWDYLNRPDRLEQLAEEYLKMEPAKADDLLQNVSAIPEPVKVPLPPKERPVFASTSPAPVAKPKPIALKPAVPVAPIENQEFNQLLDTLEQPAQ